jgi:hypothetical protein
MSVAAFSVFQLKSIMDEFIFVDDSTDLPTATDPTPPPPVVTAATGATTTLTTVTASSTSTGVTPAVRRLAVAYPLSIMPPSSSKAVVVDHLGKHFTCEEVCAHAQMCACSCAHRS